MFEDFVWSVDTLIQLGTLVGILVIGITWLYQRGKSEGKKETCIQTIEENQNTIMENIQKIENTIGKETDASDEEHETLHTRITNVEKDVSYIKGKIDQALKK